MVHESRSRRDPLERAARATTVAALFAIDPFGTAGVCLRSAPGAARDLWIDYLRSLLPPAAPWKKLPLHIDDDRLLGGVDLAASLVGGRPVFQSGILMEADGGIIQLAMAERVSTSVAARVGTALDIGEVVCERDGFTMHCPVQFGVLALDEGIDADETPPASLLDRMAFLLDLEGIRACDFELRIGLTPEEIAQARVRLAAVTVGAEVMESLCAASMSLGLTSIRTSLLALRVSRAIAAADGRTVVDASDAALAAELVYAPRAQALPQSPSSDAAAPPEPQPPQEAEPPRESTDESEGTGSIEDWVLAAAVAAIPPGLLESLRTGAAKAQRCPQRGKSGLRRRSTTGGRPRSSTADSIRNGNRLDLLGTMKTAAPWQRARKRHAATTGLETRAPNGHRGLILRREDFRVKRYERKTGTVTLFVVDASGSAALHRLGEAKGAVELLLSDCYVRRDRVALIAFRGLNAELLLPPTRSLVRAKRCLSGLPGGGGTPLALALDLAARLAQNILQEGESPLVVLMTDARANITRDGQGDRERARADAEAAAQSLRGLGIGSLLLDTSPRPNENAAHLARLMGANYVPLPYANASSVSSLVRGALPGARTSAPGSSRQGPPRG